MSLLFGCPANCRFLRSSRFRRRSSRRCLLHRVKIDLKNRYTNECRFLTMYGAGGGGREVGRAVTTFFIGRGLRLCSNRRAPLGLGDATTVVGGLLCCVVVAVVTSPFLADRKEVCGEAERNRGMMSRAFVAVAIGTRDTRDGRVTRTKNIAGWSCSLRC